MSSPKHKPTPSFDLLYGLAQELDAPLQSLVKSSRKLISDYKSRDFEYISYKDFKNILTTLEQINRQLHRCSQTTQRMMLLRNSPVKAKTASSSVNSLITEIIGVLEIQLKSARVSLGLHLGKHMPPAAIGRVDCQQVIHNVLLNAIQAMPAGGKITIHTSADPQKKTVSVNIQDEGVGITPEHLSKVFEPFFTTKERGIDKNSGLGLSIVYSLVHAAGGDIHIQSSLRKGTMVHIEFPTV